jgi:hypothetical protein
MSLRRYKFKNHFLLSLIVLLTAITTLLIGKVGNFIVFTCFYISYSIIVFGFRSWYMKRQKSY